MCQATVTSDTNWNGNYDHDANEDVDIDIMYKDNDNSIVEQKSKGNEKEAYKDTGLYCAGHGF